MDCLHRITAQLPLEDIDGANPEALEDIGRPSTSSTPASHSHGQHAASHQVVSRPDPPPTHMHLLPQSSLHLHMHVLTQRSLHVLLMQFLT